MKLETLKEKVNALLSQKNTAGFNLQAICDLLEREILHYDWVGFYFKNGDKNELKLAQYT